MSVGAGTVEGGPGVQVMYAPQAPLDAIRARSGMLPNQNGHVGMSMIVAILVAQDQAYAVVLLHMNHGRKMLLSPQHNL